MRVCVLAYTFYEADNRVRRYAETLARAGHEVEVFALRWSDLPWESWVNGVRVFRVQERAMNEKQKWDYLWRLLAFLFRSAWRMAWEHFHQRYDLVHVHSVPDFLVFGALVPKLTGTPVILDIHDILPEFYASKFKVSHDSLIFKTLLVVEKICTRFSDHVIIANDLWRERLLSRSVAPDKCTTVLNYPDPCIFRRFRPKNKSPRFVLMYPGTIAYHQGLDIAVRAMTIIARERDDVDLHIYGNGPAEQSVRDLIQELKLQDRVTIFTPLALDAVPNFVIDADLGVVPKRADSFAGDAFSTKTLEFMALAVPILVARTRIDQYYFNDGLVEFFTPEDHVDFATKVLRLVADPARLETMRQRGLAFVEEHSWEKNQLVYFAMIRRLTGHEVRPIGVALKPNLA